VTLAETDFAARVAPHRRELLAHLYRMLGSVHDAEDALQETLVRAWRGLERFEERSSLRSWLYRIATNVALTAIDRRGRRAVPLEDPASDPAAPLGEPRADRAWLEPFPDDALGPEATAEQREGVELAFVAALQHLPPNQRAALLLRDVLGLSAKEVADALETSVASVTSALQHARTHVGERVPERSQQETLRALGDARLREIVDRYTSALEQGDVDAMVELLAEDVTWAMPPWAEWYGGIDDVRVFLADKPMTQAWRHVRVQANGQLAVGCFMREKDGVFRPYVIDVIDLRGDRITSVTGFFMDAERFAAFGLPPLMRP
jgi:RNA polymerase sigma-70 factor (ECF subfamily)